MATALIKSAPAVATRIRQALRERRREAERYGLSAKVADLDLAIAWTKGFDVAPVHRIEVVTRDGKWVATVYQGTLSAQQPLAVVNL